MDPFGPLFRGPKRAVLGVPKGSKTAVLGGPNHFVRVRSHAPGHPLEGCHRMWPHEVIFTLPRSEGEIRVHPDFILREADPKVPKNPKMTVLGHILII